MRPGPSRAGRFDIADIVRDHRAELEACTRLSREQKRVLTDIAQCRTAALGGHVDHCDNCDYEHPSYNSCRNRHCPKCQALAQEKWIEARRARMLDVRHFHVVFTLPAELRPLAAFAPNAVFTALFRCAQQTLSEFAETRLSGTLGATLVLHTWARDLTFHPHIHAIVTGGGLGFDGTSWRSSGRAFLFPVRLMAVVFRAKMLDQLRHDYRAGAFAAFEDFRDPEGFGRLLTRCAHRSWNVYSKPSFASGRAVLEYLGRYTHRVGIANSRIVHVDPHSVTFRTKNGETETVTPVAFLQRFVRHVLPDRFHKIRHIGLYASTTSDKREAARQLLGQPCSKIPTVPWRERFAALTGRDLSLCPHCAGPLRSIGVARPHARAPPSPSASLEAA